MKITALALILPLIVYLPIPGLAYRLGSTILIVGLLGLSFASEWLKRIRGVLIIVTIVAVVKLPTLLLEVQYPYHAIAIFILLGFYYLVFRRNVLRRIFKHPQKGWFKFFCIYTLLAVAALFVWSHFTGNYTPSVNLDGIYPWLLIVLAIVFAIFNSLYEELLFRGCLTTELQKHSPTYVAIVAQACAFALMHFMGGFPNGLVGILLTFTYSIFMGHLFVKSRSILPCIASHFVCDLTVFTLIALQ